MADTIFYVRDAKTGELIPFKAINLINSYGCDGATLLLLNLAEVIKWPIQ